MLRSTVLSVLLVVVAAPAARAQEFHHNAYGMYVAPTFYGIAKGTDYERATSGGGLDFGLYYAHAFAPTVSVRLEARYATRALEDVNWNEFNHAYDVFRLSEQILEIPLLLQLDRRVDVSGHQLRISVGGGASYQYVLEQELLEPFEIDEGFHFPPTGSYQKLAMLFDGGTTFDIDRRSAVFLRLRFGFDAFTWGEASEDSLVRRFWATGFYAGFEYGL